MTERMILFSGIRDPSGWQPGRAVGQAVHALWKRGRGRGEEEAGGQGLPIFNLDLFSKVNKSSQQQKTTRSSSTSRTSTTSTMQQVSTALEQIQVSLVASYGNLSLINDHGSHNCTQDEQSLFWLFAGSRESIPGDRCFASRTQQGPVPSKVSNCNCNARILKGHL